MFSGRDGNRHFDLVSPVSPTGVLPLLVFTVDGDRATCSGASSPCIAIVPNHKIAPPLYSIVVFSGWGWDKADASLTRHRLATFCWLFLRVVGRSLLYPLEGKIGLIVHAARARPEPYQGFAAPQDSQA